MTIGTGMTFDEFLTAWGCTAHDPAIANDALKLQEFMGERREPEVPSLLLEQLLAASVTANRAHK